jgi:hypothetical protein
MNGTHAVTMHARRLRPKANHATTVTRLLPVLASCTLAVGCGGNADDDSARSAASEADVATSQPTAGTGRDACELIPVEQIAAIVGKPVVANSEPGAHRSYCGYADPGGQLFYLELTVYWDGGKEELETVQTATGMAPQVMAEEPGDDMLIDSIVRPGPVEGLGDVAFFSDLLPSYVLTGDVLLEMGLQQMPDAKQHFRPLASTALARL